MKCQRCGAVNDPTALECPYCQLVTPAGAAARQRAQAEAHARAHWTAAAQHQQSVVAHARMASLSKQSVIWAAVSFVFCCTPLSIVGLVQAIRARSLAAQLKTPPLASATAGLVLSIVSIVSSIGLMTWAGIKSARDEERGRARAAEIERELGDAPARRELDHDTACKLAEIYTLRNRWKGNPGYSSEDFECVGKLVATPERAELEDFAFTYSSSRFEVSLCFKRGTRWYIDEMREDHCPDAPQLIPASATGDAGEHDR